jgi:hypothetical protein
MISAALVRRKNRRVLRRQGQRRSTAINRQAAHQRRGAARNRPGGCPNEEAFNSSPSDAVRMLTDGFTLQQLTGATLWTPFFLSHLARAYSELCIFEDARRCIHEAITMVERTKERWCEAEVYRTAGQ